MDLRQHRDRNFSISAEMQLSTAVHSKNADSMNEPSHKLHLALAAAVEGCAVLKIRKNLCFAQQQSAADAIVIRSLCE